jgi:CrcB protein
MLAAILAVSLGAALGALLRWGLGAGLNHVFPSLPPGTLVANLLGGYLVGLTVALFATRPEWPVEWRLFAITGFLGGLTTFSTFSAEVVQALQAGRTGWAMATVATHLAGSLLLTLAGMATPSLFKS